MSRSRKVEPETAVFAAMSMFWKHGYCGLGTRQLEQETGITRFTLQTTYGGKMKLFLVTLDAYLDSFESSEFFSLIGNDLDGVAAFFEARANPSAMSEMSCYGCFMLNSMIEFSSDDPEINMRTERYFEMLRNGFRRALAKAQDLGDIPPDFDVVQKSEVLLSAALGLNVIIRAARDSAAGSNMADATAQMVRSWATH